MAQLIVHCGMPKAGSTAIQRFLFENQRTLLSQGILFPVSGRYNENDCVHNAVFLALCPSMEKIRTPLPAPSHSFDVYCDLIQQEMQTSQAKRVFLTSEMLFNPVFDIQSLEYLKQRMNFDKICIVIILRSQESHIESGYAQRVTGPQKFSGSPAQHLEDMRRIRLYDYYNRLVDFERVFGKNNLHVFWYDDIKDNAIRVLQNVLEIDDRYFISDNNRTNVRKSWFYVEALRLVNSRFPGNNIPRSLGCKLIGYSDKMLAAIGIRNIADRLCRPYSEEAKNKIKYEFESMNELVKERYISKPTLFKTESSHFVSRNN